MVAAPERESGCLESESGFIGTEAGFFGAEAGFVETGSGRSSNNPMKGFTKCESVVSAATSSCPRAAREKPTHEKNGSKRLRKSIFMVRCKLFTEWQSAVSCCDIGQEIIKYNFYCRMIRYFLTIRAL